MATTVRPDRQAEREAVRALREQGLTLREIAEVAHVHLSTVSRWMASPETVRRWRRRDRVRYHGHVIEARECAGYGCHAVIPAEVNAKKMYCGESCRRRAMRMRKSAREMA